MLDGVLLYDLNPAQTRLACQLAGELEVLINAGPFAGLVGIIQNPPDARGRVKVLLELLGRHVKVDVPVACTESPSVNSPWTIAEKT